MSVKGILTLYSYSIKNIALAISCLLFVPTIANAAEVYPCNCAGLQACTTASCIKNQWGGAKCAAEKCRAREAKRCITHETTTFTMASGCTLEKILKKSPNRKDCPLAHAVKEYK